MSKVPIDVWVEDNAEDLLEDIQLHMEAYHPILPDDVEDVARMIMMSVRQWSENRYASS